MEVPFASIDAGSEDELIQKNDLDSCILFYYDFDGVAPVAEQNQQQEHNPETSLPAEEIQADGNSYTSEDVMRCSHCPPQQPGLLRWKSENLFVCERCNYAVRFVPDQ